MKKMCDKEGLKFEVTYSRRVQPRDYENITFGMKEEFTVGDVSHEEAFKHLVDSVEVEIDRRLNELFAGENRKR